MRLNLADAQTLATRALIAGNTGAENASSVAAALVAAEADGQPGHGLSRVPAYADQAKAGKVNGHASAQLPVAIEYDQRIFQQPAHQAVPIRGLNVEDGALRQHIVELEPKVGRIQ